jgi:thymidylate kinase
MSNTYAPWIVVTGLDGSGKTGLVARLAERYGAHSFRVPYHGFVKEALQASGGGAPFGDVQTDRLILAADARLLNDRIRDWRQEHSLLVSQRGWMDNYIFGAVQGCSYAATDALLRTAELERPTAAVYLVAEPHCAFERIRHDPECDKYETLEFMKVQYQETINFFRAVADNHPDLTPFAGFPATLIDTTALNPEATFIAAVEFLSGAHIGAWLTTSNVDR